MVVQLFQNVGKSSSERSREYLKRLRGRACVVAVMYMLCFCAEPIKVEASGCERFVATLAGVINELG